VPAKRFSKGRTGEGYKEQMHIGQRIAAALPQRMTRAEVAKRLGISRTMVAREECLALFKLQVRLRAALGMEQALNE
jgi:DNA-binding transcriptional regulator LsrR (DeoR family)